MVLPVRATSMLVPLLNCTVSLAFTAVAVSLSLWMFQPFSKLLIFPLTTVSNAFNCDTFTPSVSAAPAAKLVKRRSPFTLPIETSPVALLPPKVPVKPVGMYAALFRLAPSAMLPTPSATEFSVVTLLSIPTATPPTTVVDAASPITTALFCSAFAPVPIATDFSPKEAEKAPIAKALFAVAAAPPPNAIESSDALV